MKKKSEKLICILEAENGFKRRIKMDEFIPILEIPFTYRLRISDPLIGDRIDLNVQAIGKFVFYKRTKKTAFYKIWNLAQIRNPEIIE